MSGWRQRSYGKIEKQMKQMNRCDYSSVVCSYVVGLKTVFETIDRCFEQFDILDIAETYTVFCHLQTCYKTKTIANDNRTAETERLQKFEAEVSASAEIQNAFAAFGLQPVINRLFAANKEYADLFSEYILEKGAEERIDVAALRKDCTKALGQYMDAIQYCAFEHEDVDYNPLINTLNKLNAYYNQQLKARATRRKNGKSIDEEPPIVPPTE